MRINVILLLCLVSTLNLNAQTTPNYNYYFGNLHAHSSYSDGNKDAGTSGHQTPFQNYVYSRASQHFHFLGISEHNHATAGMQRINYAKGLRQADSATINGQFVALYGMEWGTISGGGHVLVYGVDSLLGWESNNYDVFVAKSNYQGLFREINKRPGAFATLAHPETGDYGNLAGANTPFNPTADSAIVGTVMRSGPAMSTNTTYSNPSNSSYESTYRTLLAKGYHVGITLDHDNHNTTFGRTTQARMVVRAPSLTQASIMEAIRERRFYASDDWNTFIDFTINGRPVGSIFSDSAPINLIVNATDQDNESYQSVTLMRGVPGSGQLPTALTTGSGGGGGSLSIYDPITVGNYYYYVVLVQIDGDRIVTSPIWYNRTLSTGIQEEKEKVGLHVFPNPALPGPVTMTYYLQTQQVVRLEVLDALGRVIEVLAEDQLQTAGSHSYVLDSNNLTIANGVYLIRLIHNGSVTYRKLILAN